MLPVAAAPARVSQWWERIPVALRTDVPVAVAAASCWAALPSFAAHVMTGVALVALIGVHLRTRHRRVARLFRPSRPGPVRQLPRRVAYWAFLAGTAAMAMTGVLRWAGVPPEHAWHGAASYFMLGSAATHVVLVRRPLRRRLRRPRQAASRRRQADPG